MLIRESDEPFLPQARDAAGSSETETGPGERELDLYRDGASREKKVSDRRIMTVAKGSSISLDSRTAFILSPVVDPLLRLDGTGVLSSSSSELTVYSDLVASLRLSLGSAAARPCEEGPEPEPAPEPEPSADVATAVSSSSFSGSSLRLCRGGSRLLGWPCGAGFVAAVVCVCDAELWLDGGLTAALDIVVYLAGLEQAQNKRTKKKRGRGRLGRPQPIAEDISSIR